MTESDGGRVARLSDRLLGALTPPATGRLVVRDSDIRGFRLEVRPSGAASWYLLYRVRGDRRLRRHRIGSAGEGGVRAQEARRRASEIREAAQLGEDILETPPPALASLEELWALYAPQARWRERTRAEHTRLWTKHIKPEPWASKPPQEIRPAEVIAWHNAMQGTPALANSCLRLLRAMLNHAIRLELMTPPNPTAQAAPHKLRRRERYLSPAEWEAVWKAIGEEVEAGQAQPSRAARKRTGESKGQGGKGMVEEEPRGISTHAGALFRLLMLTGCRLREIMHARWEWVDWNRCELLLPEETTKTGFRPVPLSAPAMAILRELRPLRSCEWIIEGARDGQPMQEARRPWLRVLKRAEVPHVRLHDLRHSFASLAVERGVPLMLAGGLLGHKQARTTERYAHRAETAQRAAAEKVGREIERIVTGGAKVEEVGEVGPRRQSRP